MKRTQTGYPLIYLCESSSLAHTVVSVFQPERSSKCISRSNRGGVRLSDAFVLGLTPYVDGKGGIKNQDQFS